MNSAKNNLIFVHGWALGEDFFKPLMQLCESSTLNNRGYFEPAQTEKIPVGATVITHSMGLHFLGEEDFKNIKNLIICGGFLNFHQGPTVKAVRRMITKMTSSPNVVVTDFYKGLSFPEPPTLKPPEIKNKDLLKSDLMFLNKSTFDIKNLDSVENILILQGDSDMVVPMEKAHELAAAQPRAKLIIQPDWGHGFLYQYPEESLKIIEEFLCP
ncbi:MAG: alpha/beta hydrolase [SAR324 cluster bacterium]|nr:alpha/beta hydrolase [SAR324 cluster bacterium]